MRLIDADALKEDLRKWFPAFTLEGIEPKTLFNQILHDIDNAPTVEPKLKDDIIEAFNLITDQEFEHSDSFWIVTPKGKKIEFEKKRPQGEWLIHRVAFHLTCPFCGCNLRALKNEVFEGDYEYNYCPNCGADMREARSNV